MFRSRGRKRVEYHEEETLGQRVGNFVALIGTVLAITLAVVISQRFSEEALSNIVFTALGAAVCGVPTLIGGGAAVFVMSRIQQRQRQPMQPQYMVMPTIVQPPAQNSLPGPQMSHNIPTGQREWHTVGGEGKQ